MNSQLVGLRGQIERVGYALHRRAGSQASPSATAREEDDRIFRNLKQCVHVAESFHSNASSYAGTVYGGSVFGEPLAIDQWNSISDWIPEPPVRAEASSVSP